MDIVWLTIEGLLKLPCLLIYINLVEVKQHKRKLEQMHLVHTTSAFIESHKV